MMNYRPEIDGLRTVAVIPVVLYHAGFLGITGGFTGVDVFFVISGFLITKIIHQEALEGRFSFVEFYERRFRRIMPALIAVIAFVIVGSLFLLLPSQLRQLPAQILGAIFFVANIVLWRQSGYFSTAAEEKPLLHTWSLGVEEQFYIFAPIFLILLIRFAPKLVKPVLVLVTLGSFAASISITPVNPAASFYLLPTRAWELAAGSIIALGILSPPKNRIANEFLSAAGLLIIFAGMVFIDSTMAFPGAVAALPVVGASLVILSGQGTIAGAVLSWRPIRWVGLISYSLYLWHWPLIVFGRDAGWIDGPISQFAVVALSIAVAALSWRFVESPFRDKKRFTQKSIMRGTAIGMMVASIAAIGVLITDGWPTRFSEEIVHFDEAAKDVSPFRSKCHRSDGLGEISDTCIFGNDTPNTIVWADSHGVELSYALGELIPVRQVTYSACAPSLNYSPDIRPYCKKHNDEVLRYILGSGPHVDTVILTARFDSVIDLPEFRMGFAQIVEELADAGKRIIVVTQIPRSGEDIPVYLARSGDPTFHFDEFAPIQDKMMGYLSQFPDLEIFDTSSAICAQDICQLILDGAPISFDDNHPSMSTARKIAVGISQMIAP